MRLIVTLKASEAERQMGRTGRRPSREQLIELAHETDCRMRKCVSRCREVLPAGAEVQALTNLNSVYGQSKPARVSFGFVDLINGEMHGYCGTSNQDFR